MKHSVFLTAPPSRIGTKWCPDGAVCGNGDLSVIWTGTPDRIRIYFSKCDFWDAAGTLRLPGALDIYIPALYGASYFVEQDMDSAVITGTFAREPFRVILKCTVCAIENTALFELRISGGHLSVSKKLWTPAENNAVCRSGFATPETEGGIPLYGGSVAYRTREFISPDLSFPTCLVMALRDLPVVKEDGSGDTVLRFAVGVMTGFDTAAWFPRCLARTASIDEWEFGQLWQRHEVWWKKFWAKSSVTLDPSLRDVELHWYAGIYFMACCARNGKFPPGIWGNYITSDNPAWKSDYHLNYNFEAPFYAVTGANHPELTDGYINALEEYMPQGEAYAGNLLHCRGIWYPVGIGPLGMTADVSPRGWEHGVNFLGQKSNASYAASVMVMRWYGTRDEDYGRSHIYPFLRKTADFWEDYLVWDEAEGRYIDYNDSVYEVPYYSEDPDLIPKNHNDVNPVASLGLIRMVLRCLLDMAETLGLDKDRREKWEHILVHLSEYQTMEKDGKRIFRYVECGTPVNDVGWLNIQHVYPASEIGLDSAEQLEIARNTVYADQAWSDMNGCSTFFAAAVRLGLSPGLILEQMQKTIAENVYPNAMIGIHWAAIQNCSLVPNAVNEMLMQSHEKVLRFFPVWNRSTDAAFTTLRADGAFLVSAFCKNGEIGDIEIHSEKGMPLITENPYDRCAVYESVSGVCIGIYQDRRFEIATSPGVTYRFIKA